MVRYHPNERQDHSSVFVILFIVSFYFQFFLFKPFVVTCHWPSWV